MANPIPLEYPWILVPESAHADPDEGRFSLEWCTVLRSLQILVATTLIALTLIRVVRNIKSQRYDPSWSWIRVVALFLQLNIASVCVPGLVLELRKGTANVNWLYVGVRIAFAVMALINALAIGQGTGSGHRGLYHILQCMVCLGLQSLHAYSAFLHDWIFQALFAVAFLLDIFYSTNVLPCQFSPSVDSNYFLEIISYSWINPIVKMGASVTLDHLPDTQLLSDITTYKTVFTAGYAKKTGAKGMFWGFLVAEHRTELACGAICRLIDDCSKFSLPWLLRYLLSSPSMNIATALFCCRAIGALCGNFAEFCLRRIGVRYRAVLAAVLYEKTLRIGDLTQTTTIDVTTLTEVDAQRLSGLTPLFNDLWSLPLQVALCISGVLFLLSWEGAVAIAFTVAFVLPLLSWINKKMAFWISRNMVEKDRRTRLTREVLKFIKSIKMHALESAFTGKLSEHRDAEVQAVAKLSVVQAAMVCVMQTVPCVLTFVAFCLKLWRGQQLQPDVVFASIMLFTMLNNSLTQISAFAMNLRVVITSESRIQAYLQLPEDNLDIAMKKEINKTQNGYAISLKGVHLAWPLQRPLLSADEILFLPGTLNVITGPVGSGKSSFLLGIVRQLQTRNIVVAFFTQDAFLLNGTIRDNILFGKPFDPRLYDQVVEACELKSDFARLQYGDHTPVSGSVALSGGQRSRICLARAAYSQAEVYVLDDPLAAVDTKVQKKIIARVLGKSGLFGKTTRIMASQTPELLRCADQVMTIAEGTIKMREEGLDAIDLGGTDDEALNNMSSVKITEHEPEPVQQCNGVIRNESADMGTGPPQHATASTGVPMATDQISIDLASSPKSRHPFLSYVSHARKGGWLLSVSLLLLARGMSVAATYVLKLFSTELLVCQLKRDILIYGLLSTCQALFFFVFVYVTYTWCILPACKKLHDLLASSVILQEIRFFETESIGGVLNLFTNDLARIDNSLSGSVLSLIGQYANLLLACCVMVGLAPLSLAFLAPLAFLCYKLQQLYIKSLHQLRQLDVSSRAPLLGYLQEAESGRTVIGIFHYVQQRVLAVRSVLEGNMKALFPLACVDVWLGLRLEILSVTLQVLAIAALLAASVELSTLGFVMTYVFQITATLSAVARFTATLEIDTVSLSRIDNAIYDHRLGWRREDDAYHDDPGCSEDSTNQPMSIEAATQSCNGATRWPHKGKIEFRSVSARYGPSLPPCLISVSFEILPGEKIAVVGRTGAGKSSLLLLLMAMVERMSGDLLVDGLDVSKVDPTTLRQSFALIPQDPVIFSASIRQNVDPFGLYSDEQIKWALQESGSEAGLRKHLFEDPLQSDSILDCQLDAQGSLSAGQIQLVGLARALLSPSKVLILDEATSGVDFSTEQRMHEVLRNNFHDATCIAIMHRLELTLDFDKVLVLDEGRVVEFDAPSVLVTRHESLYASMLQAARLI